MSVWCPALQSATQQLLGVFFSASLHTKLISACASYRYLAVRYLLYPLTKLNIFNGEVRFLKFKNRLWWIEKSLFLKDALELLSSLCDVHIWESCDSCSSPSLWTHFQLSWTCALSSSVWGFWWAICRFYGTSVNLRLGYASRHYFNLFLGYSALGFLAERAGETSVHCWELRIE